MFNSGLLLKGLSLTKVIGGLSKTLQIANQVIPLYQKAKPMIQNARNIMGVLKTMSKTTNTNSSLEKKKTATFSSSIQQKKEENTSPTFFL